jgi:hypothetical protein
MEDWNVVVTVRDHQYTRSWNLLQAMGSVRRTAFHNVLVMSVVDLGGFLDTLGQRWAADPRLNACMSRVAPCMFTFDFSAIDVFDTNARALAARLASQLADGSFHVRLHRRGLKDELPSHAVERQISTAVLDALSAAGGTATISFDDPDAVIDVETVGRRAGLSIWTRGELQRYPFLRVD